MIPVRTKGKTYQLPESWDELTQSPADTNFALGLLANGETGIELCLRFVLHKLKLHRNKWWRLKPEDGARLAEIVSFLNDAPPALPYNPTPNMGRLWAPAKLWRDLRVWEYAQAEKFFRNYIEESDITALDNFLAVLFRPRRWAWWLKKGDSRTPYHDQDREARAAVIAKLPMAPKLGYLLHFLHFRTEIVQLHPYLHSGNGAALQPAQAAMQWADTIIALAQPGNEEQTANASLAYTLRRLEMKAKEIEELNAKHKPDEN